MDEPRRLQRMDWLLLGLFCTFFYGYLLVDRRVLTTHETIHCQNVREMLADRDWIVPHCGGRPWLERPPLPHWITAAVVSLTGSELEWGYRLSGALVAFAIVLIVASTVALLYGLALGVLTGLILACMREFEQYATGPECDIYLCLIVAATLCLFMRLQFVRPKEDNEDARFFGKRPWPVLAFFVLAGLTNLAKGLIFGTIWVVLPVGSYLLLNRDLKAIRRYVWFWGWLAFVVTAGAWAVAAWMREPGILDLWHSDYFGRLKEGYMREPRYYYLMVLPMVLLPWTLFALFGLRLTARQAATNATPERFLWCWALVPLAFFSIPQGKHHHYLLQGVVPWAVLSSLGVARFWHWLREESPRYWRHPAASFVLLAAPMSLAVWLFRSKLHGPSWLIPVLLSASPLFVALLHFFATRANPRLACIGVFSLLLLCHGANNAYRTRYQDRYANDLALAREVRQVVANETRLPLFVVADPVHPLVPSWWLFYIGKDAQLLHNHTFIPTDQVPGSEALLVAPAGMEEQLRSYGNVEVLSQSRCSRYELSPSDRYTFYRLRLNDSLPRRPAVAVSPMQATGRAPGPYLQ